MLLNAVIIVLRETLEAGVLASLLLTVGNRFQLGLRWLWFALICGCLGALVYATNLGSVSRWFDYNGQEVVNASMQYGIYLCLLAVCLLISSPGRVTRKILGAFLAVTATLAFVREGTEITVFFMGLLHDSGAQVKALTSGFIGLMIGLSVGILIYYVIMSFKPAITRQIQMVMLVLMAAGMVEQATRLLLQADWLPATMPLWDSNGLLQEQSLSGQVAYAIFGYEATPTLVEVWFYFSAIGLILLSLFISRRFMNPANKRDYEL